MLRRSVVKGIATIPLTSLVISTFGLPAAQANQYNKWNHNLFSTVELPDLIWQEESVYYIDVTQNVFDTNSEIDKEMISGLQREKIATIEQYYLNKLRESTPVAVYDMNDHNHNYTFVGEIHNHFIDVILDHADKDDNSIIVGPTALTILMSASNNRFKRNSIVNYGYQLSDIQILGSLNKLKVLIDPYANERTNVLIGNISQIEEERKASVVKINETDFKFGLKSDYKDNWKSIGINSDTLSFI